MENIEKEIEDCFSLLFYFEWATSNSCPKPLAALAQPYRSLGHSRAPRHSSTCTLCWSPPAAPPQVSTEGTAVSLGARHGCSYGLTDDTSFQYRHQSDEGKGQICMNNTSSVACLLVEISELKHWELLRRDYTYHRWTRRGLWEEDTRKDSWGQGHKEGLLLLSLSLPVCFQTAQAFLFRGTLAIGVQGEKRFENEKVFLIAFC